MSNPTLATTDEAAGLSPDLPLGMRTGLYAVGRSIDPEAQARLGLRIPFDVYFQDPLVAANDPDLAFDTNFLVPGNLGCGTGPPAPALPSWITMPTPGP